MVSISLLEMEQLRLREGDSLIKDHTASEWESWDFNSSQSVCRACAVSTIMEDISRNASSWGAQALHWTEGDPHGVIRTAPRVRDAEEGGGNAK